MAGLVLAFFAKSGALTVWEPTDGKKGGKAFKRKWRRHDVQAPKQLNNAKVGPQFMKGKIFEIFKALRLPTLKIDQNYLQGDQERL